MRCLVGRKINLAKKRFCCLCVDEFYIFEVGSLVKMARIGGGIFNKVLKFQQLNYSCRTLIMPGRCFSTDDSNSNDYFKVMYSMIVCCNGNTIIYGSQVFASRE